MNIRLTITAAVAVILASFSIYPLINGWGWFFGGAGAVIIVAAAGLITRLPRLPGTIAGGVLTAIACLPLLGYPGWLPKVGAVAIVAVTVASSVLRRYLVTYLAALLIYLNAGFAAGLSTAGFLPTRASLQFLGTLARGGMAERAFVPPVPGIHGVVLLAAGGIGLMAVATDLLAVRLRSPAIAGLPLLALFSVPITTNAKEGGFGATIVFCLGVIGYLAILAADGRDRLRIWGRLVTVWQSRGETEAQGPDTQALAAAGRRIGLAAVCIAIVLPLVLPGISVHGLFSNHTKAGPGGKTRVQLPNPIAQMQRQLQDTSSQTVLTYTTNAPDPSSQYLQVYVLNAGSNGAQWTLVPPGNSTQITSHALRLAPGASDAMPEISSKTQIKLAPGVTGYGSKLSFLPTPYAPAGVSVSGQWEEDNSTLMLYSTKTALGGLSYTVSSKVPAPTATELADAPKTTTSSAADDYSDLPNPDIALSRLAVKITKGKTTPFEEALALQKWFTTGNLFHYSLSARLPDTTAGLMDFLTKTHRGFCQQFAIGMAELARALQIPARVAVGYTGGTPEGNGTWRVTTADAHAWPELYFSGLGWLRFEPTPTGQGGQNTAKQPDYATTTPGGPATPVAPAPSQSPGAAAAPVQKGSNFSSKLKHLEGSGPAATTRDHGSSGSGAPVALIILAILIIALITPVTARVLTRRRRWRRADGDIGAAHAAWRELRDDLADYGMACRVSETPRSVSRRITRLLGLDETARQALDRIAQAEERALYATAAQPSGDLRADVGVVRNAMSQEATRMQRWRARLLPPSTLGPARAGLLYALDVFGWMEAAGQRLRDRTRPHGQKLPDSHHGPRQVLG